MRCVGVDLGTVRIGIAISDDAGLVATPYEVLERDETPQRDHRNIAELVRSVSGEVVVVGLPLSLNGNENAACRKARREVAGIEAALVEAASEVAFVAGDGDTGGDLACGMTTDASAQRQSLASVQVVLHDERFTTVEAERSLRLQKMRGPKRRAVVDKVAATVLLQAWLDGR